MKAEEEDQITDEERLKSEEDKCAGMKVEEEALLALEARRQSEEEEEHLRLNSEEEARITEEARM